VAAVVAVVAALAGVAAALFIMRGTPTAAAAATPNAPASAAAGSGAGSPAGSGAGSPAGSGAGSPVLPALSGHGGQLHLMLTGKVLAVSGTSITIGGNGPSVTAAVTRTTKVTGTVRGIGGVKVGDEVSAQITGTGRKLAAAAIQDPFE
jgi:hypothetical protein